MSESPIIRLKGNILKDFENIGLKGHVLENALLSGQFSNGIIYDNTHSSIQTPYAKCEDKSIYLQETFLAYLWSFIYSNLVIFEEGIFKPSQAGTSTGFLDFSMPIMNRARELFDWGIKLRKEYSEWDTRLPNPNNYHDSDEEYYGLKANNLFSNGVSYILFHELAHLTQGHFQYCTNVSLSDIIELEKEADNFAFDMLINPSDHEDDILNKYLSIATIQCSMLFLSSNFMGIKQKDYPDIDARISNMVYKLSLDSESYRNYVYHRCSAYLRIFLILYNIENPQEAHGFRTPEEAFEYYLHKIDEVKNEWGV